MKPTAMLVNVSRAESIEEGALFRALAERWIAGAALDVWYRYPTAAAPTLPAHHPFHELPNVLMTPHVSGWTEGMLEGTVTRDGMLWPKDLSTNDRCVIHGMPGRPALRAAE
jgi:phosphoglycerate dehydrogenase-like enzyme